jgi:hypothetical protein
MKSKAIIKKTFYFLLINCTIFISCKAKKEIDSSDNSFKMIPQSEPITYPNGAKYIDVYNNNPDGILPLQNTIGGLVTNVDSFSFSYPAIEDLLKANKSKEIPDKIVLLFGVDNSGSNTHWHMMAYGMYENYLMDYPKTGNPNDLSTIYDGGLNGGGLTGITSILIDKNKAFGYHQKYYSNSNYRQTTVTKSNEQNFLLKGFIFDASQISEILYNNAAQDSQGKPITPTNVIFCLGKERIFSGVYRWHLIAYGQAFNSDGTPNNLINSNSFHPDGTASIAATSRAASVFDKADPYPPN